MKKICAIGETECNEFEVFILGGQRIDQKRKKGWWGEGSRERIEKGSREGIHCKNEIVIFYVPIQQHFL